MVENAAANSSRDEKKEVTFANEMEHVRMIPRLSEELLGQIREYKSSFLFYQQQDFDEMRYAAFLQGLIDDDDEEEQDENDFFDPEANSRDEEDREGRQMPLKDTPSPSYYRQIYDDGTRHPLNERVRVKRRDKNEKKKQRVYSKKRLVEPESNTGRKTEQSKIQQQQQQFRVKDQHGRRLQGRRRRSDVVKRIVSTTQVQRTASFQS